MFTLRVHTQTSSSAPVALRNTGYANSMCFHAQRLALFSFCSQKAETAQGGHNGGGVQLPSVQEKLRQELNGKMAELRTAVASLVSSSLLPSLSLLRQSLDNPAPTSLSSDLFG